MKTRFITAFLYSLLLACSSITSNESESLEVSKFIKELDASTFNTTIESSNVLLEFYTQWCGHCKALDKVLVETAQTLNNQNLIIAKFDAGNEEHKEIANMLHVENYPTFFYVSGGHYVVYTGSKTTQGFVKYLSKELNTDISKYELKTPLNDINSLASDKKGLLVFVGDNTKFLNEFKVNKRISESFKRKMKYSWTNSLEFHNQFNIAADQYGLVFFNYLYSSGKYAQGNSIDLSSNIELRSLFKMILSPLFENVEAKQLQKYLDSGLSAMILVHNDTQPENLNSPSNRLINSLIPVAEPYKANFYIHKMDWGDDNLHPIFENFEIKEAEVPTIFLIDISSQHEISKFKMNETLTPESFQRFINAYKSNSLEKIINSEDVPEQPVNTHNVFRVVRKTLNRTVFDNNNDEVVMLYCVEKSDNCDDVRDRFNNISQRFNKSQNLIFAEYDINLNENDIIDIIRVPEIIYFPAKAENKVLGLKRFSGNYTSKEIVEFVTQNVQANHLVATPFENEEEFWKNETEIEQRKLSEEDALREQAREANDEDHDGEEGHEAQGAETNSTHNNTEEAAEEPEDGEDNEDDDEAQPENTNQNNSTEAEFQRVEL
jgi:thioredoxin-like negative regulator of GroEL